jgi:hypothetical protein
MSTLHDSIRAALINGPATFIDLFNVCGAGHAELRQALADLLYSGELVLAQHKALSGMFGFALSDHDDRALQSFSELQGGILLVLAERGPTFTDDMRERLCCASKLKFTAALAGLVQARQIERNSNSALRLIGDARPWPDSGTTNAKYLRKLRAKRERAAAFDRDLGAELVEEALGAAH